MVNSVKVRYKPCSAVPEGAGTVIFLIANKDRGMEDGSILGLRQERRSRARRGRIMYGGKKACWGVVECRCGKCVFLRLALNSDWLAMAVVVLCCVGY